MVVQIVLIMMVQLNFVEQMVAGLTILQLLVQQLAVQQQAIKLVPVQIQFQLTEELIVLVQQLLFVRQQRPVMPAVPALTLLR